MSGAAALAADVITAPPPSSSVPADRSTGDEGYAWQHGLYWLAANISTDSPLVLVVDDLQWCDAQSARALAFIARRLDGLPLALLLATRPLDPSLTPEAATLAAGPAVELLRLSPLTQAAVAAIVHARLATEPHDRFVQACVEATGGNPFLVGELLDEAAARGVDPSAAAAAEIAAIVPHGVANAVLLRLARLPSGAAALARALSVLGECTQVGDAGLLAGLADGDAGLLAGLADGDADGAAVLRHAQERLPAGAPAREQLEVALLGASYGSVSARRAADAEIANLLDPGGPACGSLQATTLATLALDEVMYLRSASTAIDLAERAPRGGLPLEPHRGEQRALAALYALMFSDHLDAAQSKAGEILARARKRGAAVTVVAISAFRAFNGLRRGTLAAAAADAQVVMELAPELLGAEFLVTAVSTAVLAGLDRDETPDALRGLVDGTGVRFDPEFTPSAQLLYGSGVLRAAAGNHQAAIEELPRLRARPSCVGRRKPRRQRLAIGGGPFPRRTRPPRGGSHPGRRRGAARAIVRGAASHRDRPARPGARRPS